MGALVGGELLPLSSAEIRDCICSVAVGRRYRYRNITVTPLHSWPGMCFTTECLPLWMAESMLSESNALTGKRSFLRRAGIFAYMIP